MCNQSDVAHVAHVLVHVCGCVVYEWITGRGMPAVTL